MKPTGGCLSFPKPCSSPPRCLRVSGIQNLSSPFRSRESTPYAAANLPSTQDPLTLTPLPVLTSASPTHPTRDAGGTILAQNVPRIHTMTSFSVDACSPFSAEHITCHGNGHSGTCWRPQSAELQNVLLATPGPFSCSTGAARRSTPDGFASSLRRRRSVVYL